MTNKNQFTVLEGGREEQVQVNGVSLVVVPATRSPHPIDVRLFEEDTHMVLTVDPVMRYTEEHPIRLMTRVLETKPKRPGSVIVNNGSWYAIIHDLDAEPTCKLEWISKAYMAALRLAEKKKVQRLGLPLLGSEHGILSPGESINLLIDAITSISIKHLRIILILVPRSRISDTSEYLKNASEGTDALKQ